MANSSSSHLPRPALALILTVSAVAVGFLFWLVYGSGGGIRPDALTWLPGLNALLNSLCALCLVVGVAHIRAGRQETHRRFMLAALLCSTLFLISYIVHHALHGDTRFLGQGAIRPVYFFILISHVLLSIIVLPMVLTTAFLALTARFPVHRKVARWTLPLWLYVSVTGVAVFLLQKLFS